MIRVGHGIVIRDDELEFTASRSGGPGGQNVNKVNTRVTLYFDVRRSPSLSAEQKRRILSRLSTRISGEGVLWVIASRHRSQAANRDAAEERMAELLRKALEPRRARVRTLPPVSVERERLNEKRRRSEIKRHRSRVDLDED